MFQSYRHHHAPALEAVDRAQVLDIRGLVLQSPPCYPR